MNQIWIYVCSPSWTPSHFPPQVRTFWMSSILKLTSHTHKLTIPHTVEFSVLSLWKSRDVALEIGVKNLIIWSQSLSVSSHLSSPWLSLRSTFLCLKYKATPLLSWSHLAALTKYHRLINSRNLSLTVLEAGDVRSGWQHDCVKTLFWKADLSLSGSGRGQGSLKPCL